MITSPHVIWLAANDPHPARLASQRSYSLSSLGRKDDWLALYAPDALIRDPDGVSGLDPTGEGHRGHAAIARFWDLTVAPLSQLTFTVVESFTQPGSTSVLNVIDVCSSFPDGSSATVRLGSLYAVNSDDLICEMRAWWDPAQVAFVAG